MNNKLQHLEGKKVTPDHGNLLLSEYFGKSEKKSIVLVVDEVSGFVKPMLSSSSRKLYIKVHI